MNLTGVVSGDAVVLAVVDQDVGVRLATHRAVEVVDCGGPIRHATAVVVIEAGIDVRKIHWFGIDEFRTSDGAFGSDRRAGEQQPRKRAGLATFIVLIIHEGGVHHFMTVIVELVAADREIRNQALRQAAAVGLFLWRYGIAFVVGFAHQQRINQARGETFTAEGAG